MNRWYTTYSGYDWTPQNGYSDLFVSYVQAIRKEFHLQKTSRTGIEVTNGVWTPYNLQNKDVKVIVDRFEWQHMTSDDEACFKIKIRVAAPRTQWWARLFGRQTTFQVIFDEEIAIMFRSDFPGSPPLFKVLNPGYQHLRDLHEHHIFSGGIMCIMANPSDWNPNKDTILRALNAAIDWIVWHQGTWGNDPDGWR